MGRRGRRVERWGSTWLGRRGRLWGSRAVFRHMLIFLSVPACAVENGGMGERGRGKGEGGREM